MPRPQYRACLQDGLKLDLNQLARDGFVKFGSNTGPRGIRWTHSYWGDIASGAISADMSGECGGWLRIQIGGLDQRIILAPRQRYFRWSLMVFHLSGDEPARVGVVDAARGQEILQPASLGQTSCLSIAISRSRQPSACW